MEIKPKNDKKERNLFFYNYKKIFQKYILQEDPS